MSSPVAALPLGLAPRLAAAERLQQVLGGGRFSPFTAAEIGDGRDRALANRLATVALRRHGQLNAIIANLLERGLPPRSGGFEAVLRIGLAQLLFMPEIAAHSALFLAVEAVRRERKAQHLGKLMNAVLRRAQSEAARWQALPPALLLPEALAARWTAAYDGPVVAGFAQALLEGAPLDLTLKTAADAEALNGVPLLDDVVRLETRDRPVDALPGFAEGRWWVQDVAASLPARLIELPPGARVLDLCAAPGGKTAQLVKAGFRVTALDNDPARLGRLRTNLDRLGYAAEIVEADAARFTPGEPYDAVLLDAPCSATGTFRRHPEVIWHRDGAGVAGRVALQRRLLANAADCLKAGGVLVYCVCSLEAEEGEAQADWVREALPGLAFEPVRPDELGALGVAVTPQGTVRTHPALPVPAPGQGTLDGFFMARFRRVRPAAGG